MNKITKLSLCYICCVVAGLLSEINGAPQLLPSDIDGIEPEVAKITKFHVNTKIQMRYATTKVETVVKNFKNENATASFDMYVPKEAFVSNFTMTIEDQTYVANVQTKEDAEQTFEESQGSAGLIQEQANPEFTDGKHVRFYAKLEPQEKVTFELTYEELLHRSNGKYDYQLHIQPENQVVDDFKIRIQMNESLPLKDISAKRLKSRGEVKSKAEDITRDALTFDDKNAPNEALIEFQPSVEQQEGGGKDWKLVLNYDVEQPQDGNNVQIGAGKFIHYFSPDKLPTIAKHVIFVIDVSGSMQGRKMTQTQDAMTEILGKLNQDIDSLNILTFSDGVTHWHHSNGTDLSYKLNQNDVLRASEFTLGLLAAGGTNINDALLEALKLAKNVFEREEIESKTQQMIVFLTDGEATSGVQSSSAILSNVRSANEELQVPIHSLAFGDNADFDLLKDISNENHGFAQRIYESGNSFEQIEDFFNGISDPKLKDVKFEYLYNGQVIPSENLTSTHFDHAMGKNEYVIAGNFEHIDSVQDITLLVKANDGDFQQKLVIRPCLVPRERSSQPRALDLNGPRICFPSVFWNKTENEEFLDRLWAFKRIKYLLEDPECEKVLENANQSCKDEATELALQYNFVTEVTSLVVEADGEYQNGEAIEEEDLVYEDYHSYYSCPTCLMSKSFSSYSYTNSYSSHSRSSSSNYNNYNYPTFVPRSGSFGPRSGYAHSASAHSVSAPMPMPPPPPTNLNSTTIVAQPDDCKLVLYSSSRLRGQKLELENDLENFQDESFDDEVASLEVHGNCCWILFNQENFTGQNMTVYPGSNYESATNIVDIYKKASSAQLTTCF